MEEFLRAKVSKLEKENEALRAALRTAQAALMENAKAFKLIDEKCKELINR